GSARDRIAVREGLRFADLAAEATCFARDLINEPANSVTATRLAESAREIAKAGGLQVRILDRAACERMGMGAFLGVNRGSTEPPAFIHLAYVPKGRRRRRIALVGKGITFDSGGLDLKTAEGMATMKGDMSGAAAVLGVMKVLARLRPSVEVHGVVAATDNMPSGSATKPGDVLRAMSGKTIEVINTDAEGRLVLADALCYAREQGARALVDIATLTGAIGVTLGNVAFGAMGNDPGLMNEVKAAAAAAGEKIRELPMFEEYKEQIESDVADMKNTGGRLAGSITAAMLLREFAEDTPWVHLDIAGVDVLERERGVM